MRRVPLRWLWAALILAVGSIVPIDAGLAHPMGNFSVNHYAALTIDGEQLEIRYLLDLAEIPTFQEFQETGIGPGAAESQRHEYLANKAEELRHGLILELDGEPLGLTSEPRALLFPPGAGGLPTMRLLIIYHAGLKGHRGRVAQIHYADRNLPDRIGWKEIVVRAPGARLLSSSVPETDRSQELTAYPTDGLTSPPQDVEARFTVAGIPPLLTGTRSERPLPASEPSGLAGRRTRFTELIAAPQLGLVTMLLALLLAVCLGGLHALEPGHGKTLVAAYLVGSRGTAGHALLLGLVVSGSHTVGVLLLGAVALYASRSVMPEQLYPWLALASGLAIAALGCRLFVQRFRKEGHDHGHAHAHGSPAVSHDHDHGRAHAVSLRQLITLGVSGGIIPCPAALVVLLGAVSLNRVGFGLLLIVAFSFGLAAVLAAIGLLTVSIRRFIPRSHAGGPLLTRWMPLTSSAMITLFGLALVVDAMMKAGAF